MDEVDVHVEVEVNFTEDLEKVKRLNCHPRIA